ncbi:ABC transporter, permease protein [Marvinbryantia formatexigens DSM 14469]|uniref:ABC transporter, permease protein n=1 Tax=Marvinbryantia formatexigens DSM 14469 TaxID=478749 RepID=C6LL94_9FIRM|nr:ABC transporter permease subunit [Marvinbryantia formatexigens]EET58605.1 ABC transporter, permease protein [Marvinbryantia formatexigens DSM 14469]UWO25507.1 ABC transporter permease subunit [Marvinbryantia formatexigens DSM 14469]SDG92449.1 putative aldouronate transport system permease protein [Marvinbryantia formatexigens]
MAKTKAKKEKLKHDESLLRHVKKNWKIYTFLILPILYYVIFKYIPMLGNIIAFRRYKGGPNIFGERWVGFRYFEQFLTDSNFWQAFRNTLRLSIGYLLVRFPATLIFALLINEIRTKWWKKLVQTISYLPHFISLVVVCGMVKELLSSTGPINTLLASLGLDKIAFMSEPAWFDTVYIGSGIWQALGWGTILYLTAMTNIDPGLYEAAEMDGANRFQQTIHVTIPGILPTIMTLLIMDIGNILGSNNMQKILLLYNPLTQSRADIIDTLVYRMGISGGNFSYASAVGLFSAVIGLILVTSANYLSKKFTETSLW